MDSFPFPWQHKTVETHRDTLLTSSHVFIQTKGDFFGARRLQFIQLGSKIKTENKIRLLRQQHEFFYLHPLQFSTTEISPSATTAPFFQLKANIQRAEK